MHPPGDDLTPAEQDFRALLQRPAAYAVWAAEARTRWEATPTGKAAVAARYRDVGGFRQKLSTGAP